MSAGERFQIIVVLLSAIVTGVLGMTGIMIRDHYKLGQVADHLLEIVRDKNEDHAEFKERLTYLERSELTERRKADRPR